MLIVEKAMVSIIIQNYLLKGDHFLCESCLDYMMYLVRMSPQHVPEDEPILQSLLSSAQMVNYQLSSLFVFLF